MEDGGRCEDGFGWNITMGQSREQGWGLNANDGKHATFKCPHAGLGRGGKVKIKYIKKRNESSIF